MDELNDSLTVLTKVNAELRGVIGDQSKIISELEVKAEEVKDQHAKDRDTAFEFGVTRTIEHNEKAIELLNERIKKLEPWYRRWF